MLILSRVCAEFHDRNGAVIHRITPAMLGLFHDAPDVLKGDRLFEMLVADGSIKRPEDAREDRNLEQDPMAGAYADGREIVAASGGSNGDFEVSRNKRAVRGTVAPIEAADQEKHETESAAKTAPEAEAAADTKAEPKRTSGARSRARAGDK